jgi:peptidoglycan/xylan/chitin deacetylase (PgdA/CDA1 family)
VNPPKKSVVITFDDGFANNCSVAWPLLKRRNVPFTIFVTTGMVGVAGAQLWTERVKRAVYLSTKIGATLEFETGQKQLDLSSRVTRAAAARATVNGLKRLSPIQRDDAVTQVEKTCGRPALRPDEQERYEFLSWEQIRTMAAEGVEFGSHTVNHPILTTLAPGVLRSELQNSKLTLESQIRRECYSFAFPNGSFSDYGPREKAELSALGYRCALSLNGTLNGRRADLLEIDRININRQHDDAMFRAAAAGLLGRVRRARERWTTSRTTPAATGEVRT